MVLVGIALVSQLLLQVMPADQQQLADCMNTDQGQLISSTKSCIKAGSHEALTQISYTEGCTVKFYKISQQSVHASQIIKKKNCNDLFT